MSIVIKSNQLNTIVYKYLLQAGLSHTAYTMFNQAKLQSTLQQYKYDIKSGHLLMIIQKALIFNQIQAHINFSEYKQCLQPFYLLKVHTCKVTQKIKQQNNNLMKQLNNNLNQSIKRTNAIYNTELPSKMYDEIVYEPRSTNFFEKFHKIKYADNDNENGGNQYSKSIIIDALNQEKLAIYKKDQRMIYLTQNYVYNQQTIIQKLYPCMSHSNEICQNVKLIKLTPTHLIILYDKNKVKIINHFQMDQNSFIFKLPLNQQVEQISFNQKIPNLILFKNRTQFYIFNIQNMQQIKSGSGNFQWRTYDQYVHFEHCKLSLKSLLNQEDLLTYNIDESNIDQIRISKNKTFFYVTNIQRGKIIVYTFEKPEPLYNFNFALQQQDIKQIIWIWRNQVDYLAILTNSQILIWEVQFNAYCFKIDLNKYDTGQIKSILSLQKNQSLTYLIALGSQNIIVSDIANQKIQRVETPQNCQQMVLMGKSQIAIINNQFIYFLNSQKLAQVFK